MRVPSPCSAQRGHALPQTCLLSGVAPQFTTSLRFSSVSALTSTELKKATYSPGLPHRGFCSRVLSAAAVKHITLELLKNPVLPVSSCGVSLEAALHGETHQGIGSVVAGGLENSKLFVTLAKMPQFFHMWVSLRGWLSPWQLASPEREIVMRGMRTLLLCSSTYDGL